jgi:GT2 family glycosyltransferase
MPDQDPVHPQEERWTYWVNFVRKDILSPQGIRDPFRQWLLAGERTEKRADPSRPPGVTIVVCTADRANHIGECIKSLKQQDYQNYEILIADNSRDPEPTRRVVQAAGVRYVRVVERGLSFARNAAVRAARTPWIAFTDDDCRPHRDWVTQLMRARRGSSACMCVTGLVVPAQLESAAELTFERYGGLGRGFKAKTFDRAWLNYTNIKPAKTWEIGAGANMLIRRAAVLRLGEYDIDLGAGRPAGCSEDTDLFYRLLHAGYPIEYTPRAVVDHYHRCDAQSLQRQIHAYAKGHAAYHLRCFVRYGDYRSLIWMCVTLPRSILGRMRVSWSGQGQFPLLLEWFELRGTLSGPWLYAGAKVSRALGRLRDRFWRSSSAAAYGEVV